MAVQSIMRHSTITLTMDTYGHLFPGHEADAIVKLPAMLGEPVSATVSAQDSKLCEPVQVGALCRESLAGPKNLGQKVLREF